MGCEALLSNNASMSRLLILSGRAGASAMRHTHSSKIPGHQEEKATYVKRRKPPTPHLILYKEFRLIISDVVG